jgi:GxxExxY protein
MAIEFDDPQTFEIIGAAMEVHRALGDGFVEPIYREALTLELLRRDIPFAREVGFEVRYKGDLLPVRYRADFVCYDEVVVEIKALPAIGGREYRQLKNYSNVSEKSRGLLLNFGAASLQHRRVEIKPVEIKEIKEIKEIIQSPESPKSLKSPKSP